MIPGTSSGRRGLAGAPARHTDGTLTSAVYGLIRDLRFGDAARLLTVQLQSFPRSRAALSLLGYCYYEMQDFHAAAQVYEELVAFHPGVPAYGLYLAQSLYKAGLYPEAERAAQSCDDDGADAELALRVAQLQAAIKYEDDDLAGARALLDEAVQRARAATSPAGAALASDLAVNAAAIDYKEGRFEAARAAFGSAAAAESGRGVNVGAGGGRAAGGAPPSDLAYNLALCAFASSSAPAAWRARGSGPAAATTPDAQLIVALDDVIQRGLRAHPELTGGGRGRRAPAPVFNTAALRASALIESINLRAAVLVRAKRWGDVRATLNSLPPRQEEDLDAVTLHNMALAEADEDPSTAFKKLNFLLANPPFPPETFGNLLLLYIKHGAHDLAADVMAENAALTMSYLSPSVFEFLDAAILAAVSPDEAYRRFGVLAAKHLSDMQRATAEAASAREARDAERVRDAAATFDTARSEYIPALHGCARVLWEAGDFEGVARLLREAEEWIGDDDDWRLNMAHACYMCGKFADSLRYYTPYVESRWDALLDVTAIVLANTCVAYIMTGANERAEEVMRALEAAEEARTAAAATEAEARGGDGGDGAPPAKPTFQLCIVNLAIGTLYCAKGNFSFGVGRVIKSLEPLQLRLGPDTWFYAKRTLLALAEDAAKGMVCVPDATIDDVLAFLDSVERHGRGVEAAVAAAVPDAAAAALSGSASDGGYGDTALRHGPDGAIGAARATAASEARLLKRMFLLLRDYA